MDQSTREREERALDAIILLCLVAEPQIEDIEPDTLPPLSDAERAAIDERLGPDLIGRLIAQVDAEREARR